MNRWQIYGAAVNTRTVISVTGQYRRSGVTVESKRTLFPIEISERARGREGYRYRDVTDGKVAWIQAFGYINGRAGSLVMTGIQEYTRRRTG